MDAVELPVITLWSDSTTAHELAGELADLERVAGVAATAEDALRQACALFADRDILLLDASMTLPGRTLARLLAGWADPHVDVLSASVGQYDSDAQAWLLGEHAAWPSADIAMACSLWRGDAAGRWLSLGADAAALRSFRLPCLQIPARELGDITGTETAGPTLLHVLHSWGGGVARFARDLAAADRERQHLFLVSRTCDDRPPFGRWLSLHADMDAAPIRDWPLAVPVASTAVCSPEIAAILRQIIAEWGVGSVLVSSLVGHSLDVLRTGLPTACCLHDTYPLWPLLHEDRDPRATPLGDDELIQSLAAAAEGFPFQERQPEHWLALRRAWLEAIREHDVLLVAPSRFARERAEALSPDLRCQRWQHIAHGIPAPAAPSRRLQAKHSVSPRPLRVLVPGRLSGGKGERLLVELVHLLPSDVELVLLGCGHAGERFLGRAGVHVLKDYAWKDLTAWVTRLAPDLALLPSLVPESFGYVVSEMLALGLPVLCADIGAYAERVDARSGWTCAPNARAFADALVQIQQSRERLHVLRDHLQSLTHSDADAAMAHAWATALRPAPTLLRFSVASPEHVALRAAHASARASADRLKQSEAVQRQQQEELDRRADWAFSLKSELTRHQEALKDACAELELRTSRIKALEKQHVDNAAELRALHEQLQEAHRYYQQDTSDLAHQRDIALMQRDDLDMRLQRLTQHPWWRLGAPLRWCTRAQRRVRSASAYRLRQSVQLWRRLLNSLRIRGWLGTWRRVRQLRNTAAPPDNGFQVPNGHQLAEGLCLPQPTMPRASVVIPAYGQLDFTLACLRALADCGDATPFETIVIDDASPDDSGERLSAIPGLRYLRNQNNLGFIGSCNAGAKIASGEYLVFLNNDTAAQPGWLDALLDTFSSHPNTGLAGSQLIYPDGRLQEAGGIVFSDGSGWNYGRFGDPGDPRYTFVREVDYCSGAAIAVPRVLFEQLGGFDAFYAPAYYEDTDLAMRIRAAGYAVRYQPRSRVIHYEGVTSGTDTTRGIKAHQIGNQQKFLARWRETLRTRHPAPGTDIRLASDYRARHRVLVLDACTPTPDRDSGSLRMLAILRLLREEGCSVDFFPENHAHDGRYTQALQQLGVCCWWQPWLGNVPRWLDENGKRFDLIIVSRHYVLSPLLPLLRQHATHAQIVFDTVDLHYLREQREALLAGDAARTRAAERTREQELRLIRAADRTWVVSEAERALLRDEIPDASVDVLSNIHEVRGAGPGFDVRSGLLFVGGFRHPPNVDAALWLAHEIYPLVREHLPDITMHLVGADAPDSILALDALEGVHVHGYVPDIVPLIDSCRVGLAPLRYGAGVKGKVNHALAHGQPMVATTCAVEGMHLRDGVDVLIADDSSAFADAIVRLHSDAALWRTLAIAGIENTRRHFSADAARPLLRRLLTDLRKR